MPLATISVLLVLLVWIDVLSRVEKEQTTHIIMTATTRTTQLSPHVTPLQNRVLPWKVNPATALQKTISRQLMIACAL